MYKCMFTCMYVHVTLSLSLAHTHTHAHTHTPPTSHRRGTSSRFVPPVKREQEEGSSFGDEVRSRVLYGARGASKGSSDNQLPPELEGDERLKNIEPRMVELIMNEVSGNVIDYEVSSRHFILFFTYYSIIMYTHQCTCMYSTLPQVGNVLVK